MVKPKLNIDRLVRIQAIKVRSADVEELKKTRLLYEVYVHSSRMDMATRDAAQD